MSSLAERIDGYDVPAGSLTCWWLLQAGFVLKSAQGTVVLVDPYLSDELDTQLGLTRIVAAPLDARTMKADVVLVTHAHGDHLDVETVRALVANGAQCVGPRSCYDALVAAGVPEGKLSTIATGQEVTVADLTATAVFARHDYPDALDAVGFVVHAADGPAVYHSGDTEYDNRILESVTRPLDGALVCMNGATGNMNAHEAALLAHRTGASSLVPMHIGLWADEQYGLGATLDPAEFQRYYRLLDSTGEVVIPVIGEPISVSLPHSADNSGGRPAAAGHDDVTRP